jgi:hypothetical protein
MFQYSNNSVLCVEGGALYDEQYGIMSQSNYKQLKRRYLETVRTGGNGRTALIAFESIPEKYKQKVISLFGDPYKAVKHNQFKNYLEQDTRAIEYYNDYTLDSGEALPEKNKKEYAANAAVLNAIHTITSQNTARRKALGGSKSKIWNKIAEVIQTLPKHTYPHTLPTNVRRLKQKLADYKFNGYESLIHKGFCNKNSEKVNEEAKLWILSRWADRFNKVANVAQLFSEYNERAEVEGWKPLKEKDTIYNYLQQTESLWSAHRYGELKSKEKFTYHHTTKMPSMRDSLWYSDGTKLNYYYLGDGGKIETCQVYEVMDAYSEVFLGYHISKTEDYEAQYYAYKMAIKTSGHKPYQIGFDNQGGHKKLEAGNFLNKVSRIAIKTQPYNGKSKTIESAFGRFQQQYLKRDWFFTGQNITSKKDESKSNLEFIIANKANLPTLEEIKATYDKRRKEWNDAPHFTTGISRMEMYLSSVNPETPEIQLWDMVDLFWITRQKPVTCNASGISFREKKAEYNYMVYTEDRLPDIDWLVEHINKKFFIKYDPDDMSLIYLYEDSALGLRFIAAAETKVVINRGKQEQEDWESSFITQINEKNKQVRVDRYNAMETILEDFGVSAEQQGFKNPKISGIKSTYQKRGSQSNIGKNLKEESNLVAIELDQTEDSIYNKY